MRKRKETTICDAKYSRPFLYTAIHTAGVEYQAIHVVDEHENDEVVENTSLSTNAVFGPKSIREGYSQDYSNVSNNMNKCSMSSNSLLLRYISLFVVHCLYY